MSFRTVVLIAVLLVGAGAASAQSVSEEYGPQVSRAELEHLLSEYEAALGSSAYSDAFKERARREAEVIRTRLREGDLQVGDQVIMTVRGETELSTSYTVAPGRVLILPSLGEIPLAGVLRSELDRHLTEQLGRFIREPVVHSQALIRMYISGEVNKPGFYVVPASSLVGDAIMLAGGPTRTARMDDIEIRRADRVLWDGDMLQDAIVEGRTLDQLSVHAGDRLEVPAQGGSIFTLGNLRMLVITVPPLIFLVSSLFN